MRQRRGMGMGRRDPGCSRYLDTSTADCTCACCTVHGHGLLLGISRVPTQAHFRSVSCRERQLWGINSNTYSIPFIPVNALVMI